MKVSVLYTGALRTIRKTMRYFKQHVLLNSDVDVYACVQNDSGLPNEEWETWIRSEMGAHLKSLTWFVPHENSDWISLRDKLVSHTNVYDVWKNYLKNSGSILEYYQLYLAYLKMCQYEDTHQRYKYIIRCRTDNLFGKPVDFHWLTWSDEEVEKRIRSIHEKLAGCEKETDPKTILNYFMGTLLSDDLIENIQNIGIRHIPNRDSLTAISSSTDLNRFVQNGPYILTYRANNLYIVGREHFSLIPGLPFLYGFLKTPYNDSYWFNAENQFQAACYFSNLVVFDYNTGFEDSSVSNYDEARYFDDQYNIRNPYMVYCLVRN